jgi:hypothetical protein
VGSHPEQVQGIGVVRLDGKDLPVEGFGFGQAARQMMLEGNTEVGLNRSRRCLMRRHACVLCCRSGFRVADPRQFDRLHGGRIPMDR